MGRKRERGFFKKGLAERKKVLFILVWIHPSPPVALAQLYAETRLSNTNMLCHCFTGCLFLACDVFLNSFTMRGTNGRRKERRD